jgi:hypothetical protein
MRDLCVLAAVGALLLLSPGTALAQKSGGILKIGHFDSPASMSMLVPSRFVLEFDWRGLRLDEDIGSGSKVNRLIGEFLGQALPSVHFAHRDLT